MAMKEKILDKAQKLIQKGYLDKAIVEYRAAADLDPKDTSIRLRLGDLFVKLGRKEDAIKEYTEVAKQNSQRGFYLKAIAVYKQVLKLEDSIETHNKLADLYVKQRLIADAISEYSFIMNSFEKKGKTSEVLDLVKKMVEIDPENIGVRMKLAELYQKLGFEKDSLNEYSSIFGKLLAMGKLDRAESIYSTLYNTSPREPVILKGLADLYRKKSDIPHFIRFSKALFSVYSEDGREELAKEVCEEILKARPDDEQSLKYLKKGKYAEEAQKKEPEKPQAHSHPVQPDEDALIAFPDFDIPAAAASEQEQAGIEISLDGLEDEKPVEQATQSEPVIETQAEPELESSQMGSAEAQVPAESDMEIEFEIDGLETTAAEKPQASSEEKAEAAPELESNEAQAFEQEPIQGLSGNAFEEKNQEQAIETEIDLDSGSEATGPVSIEPQAESASCAKEEASPEQDIGVVEELQSIEEEVLAAVTELEEMETSQQEKKAEPVPAEPVQAAADEKEEDLPEAITDVIEKIEPDELIDTGTDESKEEYVDLSAELGMDKALEDMAGAWGHEGGSKDTYDEFKDGIGNQLSKEDSETHYNLGIAYMEMELYNEALKEFKIALKDPHLEFDCYTRLGLCAIARNHPEEAISFYQKGLKIDGSDAEARKGMMYELALAYESAGKGEEAGKLFASIYELDPRYRETALKVKEYSEQDQGPDIPLDDGLIEVELL